MSCLVDDYGPHLLAANGHLCFLHLLVEKPGACLLVVTQWGTKSKPLGQTHVPLDILSIDSLAASSGLNHSLAT